MLVTKVKQDGNHSILYLVPLYLTASPSAVISPTTL